jgi:hypothetical protein
MRLLKEWHCFSAVYVHDRKLWTRASVQVWTEVHFVRSCIPSRLTLGKRGNAPCRCPILNIWPTLSRLYVPISHKPINLPNPNSRWSESRYGSQRAIGISLRRFGSYWIYRFRVCTFHSTENPCDITQSCLKISTWTVSKQRRQ